MRRAGKEDNESNIVSYLRPLRKTLRSDASLSALKMCSRKENRAGAQSRSKDREEVDASMILIHAKNHFTQPQDFTLASNSSFILAIFSLFSELTFGELSITSRNSFISSLSGRFLIFFILQIYFFLNIKHNLIAISF